MKTPRTGEVHVRTVGSGWLAPLFWALGGGLDLDPERRLQIPRRLVSFGKIYPFGLAVETLFATGIWLALINVAIYVAVLRRTVSHAGRIGDSR